MCTYAVDLVCTTNTTISSDATYDNVTINENAKLTINSGATLTVKQNLTINGLLSNKGVLDVKKNVVVGSTGVVPKESIVSATGSVTTSWGRKSYSLSVSKEVNNGIFRLSGSGRQNITVNNNGSYSFYDSGWLNDIDPEIVNNLSQSEKNKLNIVSSFTFYDVELNNTSAYTEDHVNDGVHMSGNPLYVENVMTLNNGILYTEKYDDPTDHPVPSRLIFWKVSTRDDRSFVTNNVMSFIDGGVVVCIKGKSEEGLAPVGSKGESAYCYFKNSYTGNGSKKFQVSYQGGYASGTNSKNLSAGYWIVENPKLDGGDLPKVSNFQLRLGVYDKDLMQLYYRNGTSNSWTAVNATYSIHEFLGNNAQYNPNAAPSSAGGMQFAVGVKNDTKYTSKCTSRQHVDFLLKDKAGATIVSDDCIWTGRNSEAWNFPANWLYVQVPTEKSNVIIKPTYNEVNIVAVASNDHSCLLGRIDGEEDKTVEKYPKIPGGNVGKAKNLTIEGDGEHEKIVMLTIQPNATLKVDDLQMSNGCRISSGKSAYPYTANLDVSGNIRIERGAPNNQITYFNIRLGGDLYSENTDIRTNKLEFVGDKSSVVDYPGYMDIYDLVINKDGSADVSMLENVYVRICKNLRLKNGVLSVSHSNGVQLYYIDKDAGVREYATFVPENENSYVNGYFYRPKESMSGWTLFPVGGENRSAYVYMNVSDFGDATSVKMKFVDGKYNVSSGKGLYNFITDEHWLVNTGKKQVVADFRFKYNPEISDVEFDDPSCLASNYEDSKTFVKVESVESVFGTNYRETSSSLTFANNPVFTFANAESKWVGKVNDDWYNKKNWVGRVPNSLLTASIGNVAPGFHYPVIRGEGVAEAKNVLVKTTNANKGLTIDGGTLVADDINVSDEANAGHVVINQRYDNPSNLLVGSTNYKKFTINRTFKTNRLYYNASATKEGSIESGIDLSTDVLEFYEVSDESYKRQESGNFYVGKGQFLGHTIGLAKSSGETERTITQIGSIYTDSSKDYNLKLSTGAGYSDGWNLISNPYQASLKVYDGAITLEDGISPSVWIRGYDNGRYGYTSMNILTGVSVAQGSATKNEDGAIAPQQAFFVFTETNMATIRIKRPKTADAVKSVSLKSSEVVSDVLRLTIDTDEALSDEMAFVFREGGTMDAASVDTYKRFEKGSYNQIYSLKGENANAISWYPAVSEVDDEILPIAVRLSSLSKNGVITATNLDVFDESVDVTLVDDHEKIAVDLRKQNEYQFEASASGETLSDRFYIVLKSVEADVENEEGDKATAIEKIETKNQNGPAYNVIGQRVARNYRGIVVENGKKYIKW